MHATLLTHLIEVLENDLNYCKSVLNPVESTDHVVHLRYVENFASKFTDQMSDPLFLRYIKLSSDISDLVDNNTVFARDNPDIWHKLSTKQLKEVTL